MASSGRCGTPTLRTTITSSGASRASATRAATGTPPRGRASTTGSSRARTAGAPQGPPGLVPVGEDPVSPRALVHTPPPCPGAPPPGRGFGPHQPAPADPPLLCVPGRRQTGGSARGRGAVPAGRAANRVRNRSRVPVSGGTGVDPAITGEPPEERVRQGPALEPDGWARHSLRPERSMPPWRRDGSRQARWYRGAARTDPGDVVLVQHDDRAAGARSDEHGDHAMTYPKVDCAPRRRRSPAPPAASPRARASREIEERVLRLLGARTAPSRPRSRPREAGRGRRQRVRLLRRAAVRQRPAALRPPADRLRQGPRAALPDHARAPGRAPVRLGQPRAAGRARGAAHARPARPRPTSSSWASRSSTRRAASRC